MNRALRNWPIALILAGLLFTALPGCPPIVLVLPSGDAGPGALPSCDGLSVCENAEQCAGEQTCSEAWCQSDKDTMAHWCTCGSPNPGTGICSSGLDCPKENACWSWTCEMGYCQAIAKDGGTP